MIKECGEVIRLDGDFLWVKTLRLTTCNACQARNGCGQKLLNKHSASTADIKARLPQGMAERMFMAGDEVEIGLEESAVVVSSMLTYGLPLASMLLGVALVMPLDSDAVSALSAFTALFLGAALVRWVMPRFYYTQFFEPIVLRNKSREAQMIPVQSLALSQTH